METLLNTPINYWVIMVVSHMIHIYLKIESDTLTNKESLQTYWLDKFKLGGLVISFMQSVVLLMASYDAYAKYLENTDSENAMYYSFAVAFIGYSGSSLWNNIMEIVKSKINASLPR
jgi:sRNA-binding regulator protein Hfq